MKLISFLKLATGPMFFFLLLMMPAGSLLAQNKYCTEYTEKAFFALEEVKAPIEQGSFDTDLLNAALFHFTNLERKRKNRPAFLYSEAVERAATGHSEDMVKHDFYSHSSPVKGKSSMSDRLDAEGVNGGYRAENIFKKFGNSGVSYLDFAQSTVQGWMDSKGHRKNILNAKLKYLGCGTAFHSVDNPWIWLMCTQNFASEDASKAVK